MASTLLSLLLAVPVFIQGTSAFNCSIPPIYVDIHKRAVHGTSVFQYGSFIGIGSPAQNQSLWPSLSHNETTVASADFCDHSDLADCQDSTRGNFDFGASTSFVRNNNYKSLDTADASFNDTVIFGQDTLHLYTHYFETDGASQNMLPNTPVQVATNGSQAPGIVGLGLSSNVLQQLYDQGLIAGRTYSLYIGSGMDRAGGVINGSNTFGGYDAGRFTGDVHTYPIQGGNKNPLSVTVSDIILNDPTGLTRNVSLFDTTAFPNLKSTPSPFEARITTDQYPLSFPYELTQNFISALQASPSDNPDGSLKLNSPFNGTMTIVLSDGFSITLPPSVMYNTSGLSPVAARDQNSTADFYLSLAWLSQVYLMIDYDAYNFHLAQALPEAKFVMPVTFCPKSTPAAYVPPGSNVLNRAQLVGAIVGGVVGGCGFFIFGICLFQWWRRQRMIKAMNIEEAKGKKTKMARFEVLDSGSETSEERTRGKKWRFWRR